MNKLTSPLIPKINQNQYVDMKVTGTTETVLPNSKKRKNMGQLFKRIKQIGKAHQSDRSSGSTVTDYDVLDEQSDDRELSRLIDNAVDDAGKANPEINSDQNLSDDSRLNNSARTLGVSHDASFDEIKIAYINQIKIYHPDLFAKSPEADVFAAEQKTADVNAAYDYIVRKRGQ
ncbi:MAG: DnaJ domain-containing protein [Candidatus Kapabacteria bacterium]|nr:DnaJ domain-containing protein [Candidatus Kapabacteria bacterium]